MKARQIPSRVRILIGERSSGVCEVCGQERATQVHHRRPRGMGGSRDPRIHEPSMLLHVGDHCHHHIEHNRGESIAEGWLLTHAGDRPVRTWIGYLLLDDGGGWTNLGTERPIESHHDGCEWWTSDVCSCGGIA